MKNHEYFFQNRISTRTIFPDGIVPADFNSFINHIRKQRLELELKRLKGDFDWINERTPENRHITDARVVWVENISEQFHARP